MSTAWWLVALIVSCWLSAGMAVGLVGIIAVVGDGSGDRMSSISTYMVMPVVVIFWPAILVYLLSKALSRRRLRGSAASASAEPEAPPQWFYTKAGRD